MLAGQFVRGLAKIHRREAFLLVEIEQLLGQAEAHAQPLRFKTWKQGNIGSNECFRFYTSTNQNKRIFHINELINSTFGPYLLRAHNA